MRNGESFLMGIHQHIFIFLSFHCKIKKIVASRIQNWIAGVEGESADHYTTTTGPRVMEKVKKSIYQMLLRYASGPQAINFLLKMSILATKESLEQL